MEDHWVDVVNELEAKVKELEGKLAIATENAVQAVKERDLAIIDRQNSDQVAAEIAMRAGHVLQDLKSWREITIHPWCTTTHQWCSDRLDEIIAMMDWT